MSLKIWQICYKLSIVDWGHFLDILCSLILAVLHILQSQAFPTLLQVVFRGNPHLLVHWNNSDFLRVALKQNAFLWKKTNTSSVCEVVTWNNKSVGSLQTKTTFLGWHQNDLNFWGSHFDKNTPLWLTSESIGALAVRRPNILKSVGGIQKQIVDVVEGEILHPILRHDSKHTINELNMFIEFSIDMLQWFM